jgi:hypothetical protein
MAVHEIRYRAYDGPTQGSIMRWLAIPRYTLMAAADRMFVLSMFGAGSLALIGMTLFLVVVNTPALKTLLQMQQLPRFEADLLMRTLLRIQTWISLPTLVILVPRLVTTERQHQALPLLYSRPVTRFGYLAGKWAAAFLPLSWMTWVQALLFSAVMCLTYPKEDPFWQKFLPDSLPMMALSVIAAVTVAALLALVCVAASACTRNQRFATGMLLFLLLGSGVLSGMLQGGVHESLRIVGIIQLCTELYAVMIAAETGEFASPVAVASGIVLWAGFCIGLALYHLRIVVAHRD